MWGGKSVGVGLGSISTEREGGGRTLRQSAQKECHRWIFCFGNLWK